MDTANEILDAIEILSDKKISENITKVLTGICKSVNINKNTCVMDSNGVSGTVYFYGSPPEVNGLYRIFVPSNDMSRSFIIVPPKFTVNPNLLDNWYFGRPVNQRGQTEYKGDWIYSFDRWKVSPSATVSISGGGLSVIADFQQAILSTALILGQKYTMSVLSTDGRLGQYTFTLTDSLEFNVGFGFGYFVSYADGNQRWFRLYGTPEAIYLAIKLELGPTQTLAHQENGRWVLNEIPDYGEQLRRCQRYALKIGDAVRYCSLGNGVARDSQFVSITIPTPVTMRTVPGLIDTPVGFIIRHSDTNLSVGANFSVDAFSQNSIMLRVQSQVALTPGDMWEAFLQPNGSIMFSAEL